jgi:pyrroloquinoline quinone (PQQ) biosynthesis protein C
METTRILELEEILKPYRMETNLPMLRLAEKGIPLPTARRIAREYGPGNAASPQIMAAGISQIWDEDLRISLVVNLYEECGEGDKRQSHIAMFGRFMEAVDVNLANVKIEPGSLTDRLISTFLKVCCEGPDYRALAILHGFEDVFSYICGLVGRGLEKSGVVSFEAAEFFRHHAVSDLIHAERMRDAMLGSANTEEKWRECLDLARLGASLIYDVYDSIARESN